FKRAMTVIGLIPFERFDTLAVWYSQDPSVVANHGDLGFFSGGRMIAEFEDAAYRLPVGEYTREPVRTRFGYHVIKVTGRRPASGPVRFSHILLRFSPGLSDTTAVRDSAWAIYNELRAGGDFGAAVQQYSQDPTTVPKGGDVGYIERYRLPESLASLLYNTPVGTVSEPVPFPYGYHLFKVTDIKPFPHLADIERDLRNQYQQSRYATDYQNYLGDLKRKHRLELNAQTMHELTHALDSLKTASSPGWSDTLSTEMLDKTLFTFTTESVSVADLVSFMSANPEFMSTLLTSSNVENIVSRLTEIRILEEEAADVPRRHPNFVELMKEYEDGVLLFRIEQDEVWSKVAITDSTLQAYYEENKEQYRFPDRVRIQEVLVASDSLIQAIYRRVQNGEDLGLLADEFTIRPGMKQRRGIWDLVPVDSHEATKLGWTLKSDSISAPFQTSDGWAIITPHQKDNARLKTYQEALPEITSVYREQASKLREQEWLESLKKKFGVNIQREYLTDAFRRKTSETP
ncbi:MAG: peptidylprolyl isomerase, partial [Bacteroidota bacterium]